MPLNFSGGLKAGLLIGLLSAAALSLFLLREPIFQAAARLGSLLADRQRMEAVVKAFGPGAPLAFMAIQILQVLFAPIPGEATGFMGGYLFGGVKGFLYSTAALTLGSVLNFMIGRFLGRRYVRRIIPSATLLKFDRLVKRQGAIILFLLFVFPGFPKDWLCLFLGISTLPIKVFTLIAAIGRMPGTLILSLQGEYLFEKNYPLMLGLLAVCLGAALLAVRYREKLYCWIEKFNDPQQP
jgi:uncharacterized membrane protein YdjX (TVP38/TMEM64 family)